MPHLDSSNGPGLSADGFKPLDEILQADPRHNAFVRKSIQVQHQQLSKLILNRNVPPDVQVGFDTARNLYLYSWFVYRFITTARFQAYSTLELAIKLRAPKSKEGKLNGLRMCINFAIQQKWFKDEGIRQYQRLMRMRDDSEYRREEMGIARQSPKTTPVEWHHRLKESFPGIRNEIAHGRPLLLGNDLTVLEMCCDLINQLFPNEQEPI